MNLEQNTNTLANYIKAMVKREASREKMASVLQDFMGVLTPVFIDELHGRIASKDFSFELVDEPADTPPPSPEPKKSPKQESEKQPERKAETKAEASEKPEQQKKGKWEELEHKQAQSPRKPRRVERDQDDDKGKFKEQEVDTAPRNVIFIAGIGPNMNTITRLFKAFTKYGKIKGIESIPERNLAFIEYDDLLPAFRAVIAKRNPLNASHIRIGYAVAPDPERIEELNAQYLEIQAKHRAAKEAKAEAYAKKKEAQAKEDAKALMDECLHTIEQKLDELGKCTDEDRKREIEKDIKELEEILDTLAQG